MLVKLRFAIQSRIIEKAAGMFGFVRKGLFDNQKALCRELELKAARLEKDYQNLLESEAVQLGQNIDKQKALQSELATKIHEAEQELLAIATIKKAELDAEIQEDAEQKRAELVSELEEFREQSTTEKDELCSQINALRSELSTLDDELSDLRLEIRKAKAERSRVKAGIEEARVLSTVQPVAQKFTGVNSSRTKSKIEEIKSRQKTLITQNKAWRMHEHYSWNGSLRSGKAQQKRLAQFLLTAFNAEVDNIISQANKSNFISSHRKIENWFVKLNKLGSDHFISIQSSYLNLRLKELRVVVEYHIQQDFEKEEERYINESIREEKRVQKEIENFVIAREKEERDYKEAIERATAKLKEASEVELNKLQAEIDSLQQKLERSVIEKERAISLAQLTRSGHVYIISNKNSFGDGVFKIGMTRRLDPMDRIRELGGASVPFYFDVHGIIHTDDAPTLEKELHRRFDRFRVNPDNHRREFFKVELSLIEEAISELHQPVSLDRLDDSATVSDEMEFDDED